MRRTAAWSLAASVTLALCALPACAGEAYSTTSATSNTEATAAPMSATIAIPGYKTIDLKAGTREQRVDLHNPESNACDFRITLALDNEGDCEDEVLWTSELLGPGEHVRDIQLARALSAGEYPAALRYECFSREDGTPLNGSEIRLLLRVRS